MLGRIPIDVRDRRHHMDALAARKLDEAFELFRPRRSRISRAAAITCVQATPSPGSRSKTMRSHVSRLSSREPRTWISAPPIAPPQPDRRPSPPRSRRGPCRGRQRRSRDISRSRRYASERTLACHPFRARTIDERTTDKVWPHPIPDGNVVIGEILLGHADVRPINAVGMGEAHAGDGVVLRRARRAPACPSRSRLPPIAEPPAARRRGRPAPAVRATSRAALASRRPL